MALRFENNGERQRTPKKKKRSRNISFYAALALCVGAIALTAIIRQDDSGETTGTETLTELGSGQSVPTEPEEKPAAGELLDEAWYVSDVQDEEIDVQPVVQTTTTEALQPEEVTAATEAPTEAVQASAVLRFAMPLSGGVTCGFSGEELVFSATMCDWRVHNGLDISGAAGDEVKACADGVVESFVEDMLYGNTAIIRHADDSVMYYCGLSDTQMVSAGLIVKAGDVIGYIGDVPCEMADGPHIHLALMKDGQFIDPATVLSGA